MLVLENKKQDRVQHNLPSKINKSQMSMI